MIFSMKPYTAALDTELAELSDDMDILAGRIERLISENASTAQDQDDFQLSLRRSRREVQHIENTI